MKKVMAEKGFTLVEMMIASAILVGVMGGLVCLYLTSE